MRFSIWCPIRIFVLDSEFRVEYANKALVDYLGEALTTLLFSHDLADRERALIHPDDLPRFAEETGRMLLLGRPGEVETRLLGRYGAHRWFQMRFNPLRDAQGRVVRWFATRTDIEVLKRTQEQVREDERQIRMVADFVPHYVVMIDANGQVLYANRANGTAVALHGSDNEPKPR